jgi:hypothetical protein
MTHTMIPRTNYLMKQEPFLMQAQAGSDEAGTADRTSVAEKKKRWALKGHAQVNLLSYSMSRTMWASRHDLLVIPRYRG